MTTDNTAERVDAYFEDRLIGSDPALDAALERSEKAGLDPIAVAPTQGAFLHIIARAVCARRVLEIGTLGGYSTIWLGRAVGEDGQVVTLEIDPGAARVAEQNLEAAGLSSVVDVRLGPATDSLDRMITEGAEPFDLVFIDADKPNNPVYLDRALKLSRPGTLIIGDNVVREGAVADENSADPKVQGARALIDKLGDTPGLTATALQTVDSKGYDGFAMALVSEDGSSV
ncbi:MAG: O-methyltransferase [Pseudomonadota bacterium]